MLLKTAPDSFGPCLRRRRFFFGSAFFFSGSAFSSGSSGSSAAFFLRPRRFFFGAAAAAGLDLRVDPDDAAPDVQQRAARTGGTKWRPWPELADSLGLSGHEEGGEEDQGDSAAGCGRGLRSGCGGRHGCLVSDSTGPSLGSCIRDSPHMSPARHHA